MPRPRKCRRVGGLPGMRHFGPLVPGSDHLPPCSGLVVRDEAVVMTVDQYETIRLIDHLGLTQEECAERMDVARTTAQRIYDEARGKLALCLVEGRGLRIEGGDYTVDESPCPGPRCCRRDPS